MLMLNKFSRLLKMQARLRMLLGLAVAILAPQALYAQNAAAPKPDTAVAATTNTVATTTTTENKGTTETTSKAEAAPAMAALIPVTTGTTQTASVVEITTATTLAVPTLEVTTTTTHTIRDTGATTTTIVTAPVDALTTATLEHAAATEPLPAEPTREVAEPTTGTRTNVAEGQAPYLREIKPISIFDPEREESATPLQKAARVLSERKEKVNRSPLNKIHNVVTYEYRLTGGKEAELREEAMLRALKSAAGRVYFENYILLGRDLLEPYLKQYGRPFITRLVVKDRRTLAKDQVGMRILVSVNQDALFNDLHEKHFIAEPNLRPIVAVHLQEIVNGQRDVTGGGRGRIERTMEQYLFRNNSDNMRQPPLDVDLSSAPSLLKEARLEAQRNNVDVIITGTMSVRPISQNNIFYDRYAFEEANLTLRMYRVDTGELISEVRDRYSANAETEDEATQRVLDQLVSRSTQKLAEKLTQTWGNTMLDQPGHYRIMISGANRDDVTSLYNQLQSISPEMKIFEKSYYGDVLVVNVVYPGSTAEQLEAFLRGSAEPQLEVRRVDKRHFMVEII